MSLTGHNQRLDLKVLTQQLKDVNTQNEQVTTAPASCEDECTDNDEHFSNIVQTICCRATWGPDHNTQHSSLVYAALEEGELSDY